MSAQTNNNDLVHVRQMAQSDFDALSVKDSTTIYFVNLTGVFTEQSLGEDGDIYLGSKLLTGQPSFSCPIDEVWVSAAQPVHEESKAYDISNLKQADHLEIMADLLLGNTERTQHEALFYIELCKVTGGESEGLETPTPTYTVQSVLAAQWMELPSGTASQIRLANAHLHATINAKLEDNMAIRVGWVVTDDNNATLQPIASAIIDSEYAPISKITVHAWYK